MCSHVNVFWKWSIQTWLCHQIQCPSIKLTMVQPFARLVHVRRISWSCMLTSDSYTDSRGECFFKATSWKLRNIVFRTEYIAVYTFFHLFCLFFFLVFFFFFFFFCPLLLLKGNPKQRCKLAEAQRKCAIFPWPFFNGCAVKIYTSGVLFFFFTLNLNLSTMQPCWFAVCGLCQYKSRIRFAHNVKYSSSTQAPHSWCHIHRMPHTKSSTWWSCFHDFQTSIFNKFL